MTDRTLPLLLGEAPSKHGDRYHRFPLSGRPARVLCMLASIPPVEGGTRYGQWTWALYDHFECRNVFERYADATPWSKPRAEERVKSIYDELGGPRVIVACGRRVQAALGIPPEYDYYEWTDEDDLGRCVVIPHPSGLNRLLNDDAHRASVGVTLRDAITYARTMDERITES